MAKPLDSRSLKVPVAGLMKKLFTRERFGADLDLGYGERGLFERSDRGGLRVDLWLESSPDGIRVKGTLRGSLALECTRCLEEYRQELDIRVDEFFRRPGIGVATPEGRPLPREIRVPEEDEYLIEEGTIDLNILVNDAVVLSLPIKHLCSPGCRGLCPHCGANLNQGDCGCRVQNIDPRLEVLRELLEEP
ncbi:MAG: YceD family protein [Actinomycetota bacterium]